MLQEVIDLQQRAVTELVARSRTKREVFFKAPTGSGKTRMMADFMDRILAERNDVIFLVSTLSKGNLAQQNYDAFKACEDDGTFMHINSYLISSEIGDEEGVYIPLGYNVYVLPRDLYKEGARLAQGGLINFLQSITEGDLSQQGQGKQIFVIKDECHQATNNLDTLSLYFSKVINFSATPKLSRGQVPDVEITDEAAVEAKLIKHIEEGDDRDTVDDAINKFEEIKKAYRNLLNVNPCLIIQISNGLDAEKEWKENIYPALQKHQALKWMMIVDKNTKMCDTNDDVKKTLPVERWKDYAKDKLSTIDIIIFKMVISEGWDIPRACMLYQVRDTTSKILDEQVTGRVRRNPRLIDFETLNEEAQKLALTAWVWGVKDVQKQPTYTVKLLSDGVTIQNNIRIKTTHLKHLKEKVDFSVEGYLHSQQQDISAPSIFELYRKLSKQDNEVVSLCYDYMGDDISKWYDYTKHIDGIARECNNYKCDYTQSMEVAKDEAGKDLEVSFPKVTYVKDNGTRQTIVDWVWCRKDNGESIPFDSDAECQWAYNLERLALKKAKEVTVAKNDDKFDLFMDENPTAFLWGKNFLVNSDIKFEYYSNGQHFSYPDFVLVDKNDHIHIMEVKSLNGDGTASFDVQAYRDKIMELGKCYLACSKLLPNYRFYIPVLKGTNWTIHSYVNGNESTLTKQQFESSI